MKFTRKTLLAILAGALLASPAAIASDHTDGTQAQADPAADITDLFAWMSSSSTMTLIMDVNTAATTASLFSPAVQYVFHTYAHGPLGQVSGMPNTGLPLYGGTPDPEVDVICTFAAPASAGAAQTLQCWVTSAGTTVDYITGPASMTTPLKSSDGLVTIYAGLAADPFFFNLAGFQATAATVTAVAGSLGPLTDPSGCPDLTTGIAADAGYLGILDGQLTHGADGGPAVDNFAGLNVNAIVVQIDQSLVVNQTNVDNNNKPTDTLVSVWASTNNG